MIIVVSIAFATFSWKFIEQPFRGSQSLFPDRKRLFAISGIVMVISIGIGGIIHLRNGMGGRITRFYPEVCAVVDRAKNDAVWKLNLGIEAKFHEKFAEGDVLKVVGVTTATPTFALIGDSHALALIPAFERMAINAELAGYIITLNDQPPILGYDQITNNKNKNLKKETDAIIGFIRNREDIKTVIVVARWARYLKNQYLQEEPFDIIFYDSRRQYSTVNEKTSLLSVGLIKTVNALRCLGKKVVLVSDVPEIGYDVPRVYSISTRFSWISSVDVIRPSVKEYEARQKEANAILEELAKLPGVTLIRPEQKMFDEHGKARIMADGELLYVDDDHLSTAGALYVAPVFETLFNQMAREQQTIRAASVTQ